MSSLRVLLSLVAVLLLSATAALAASTTVQGTGDIQKMFVKNGKRAVTVKVHGLAKPCEAHFLQVQVFWGRKKAYRAEAGCYGVDWMTSLYYYANRNKGESTGSPVGCQRFKMTYNADRGFYRVFIPRGCIGLAADKIRVKAEGRNYAGSPMPGEAGPTPKIPRG